jgi:hypothetical protein
MIYIQAWKHTVLKIKKHKRLVLAIFLLQILLVISISMFTLSYQIKIIKNVEGILTPLEKANLDPASIEEGKPFLTQASGIFTNYITIKKNLTELLLGLAAFHLLFNGSLWILSHHLLKKLSLRQALQSGLKFILASFLFFVPYFYLAYNVLKRTLLQQIDPSTLGEIAKNFLYGYIPFYFVLLITFGLITIKSYPKFTQTVFRTALPNFHKILPAAVLSHIAILGSIYVLYTITNRESGLLLLIFAFVLFITTLILSRLFWISTIQLIKNENNH